MKVHGVSLHYYNDSKNNDKFYRCFIWEDHDGWNVAYHWGRDGAPHGQTKVERFANKHGVQMALDKKINEKLSKGYEYLGRGDIEISDLHLMYGGDDASHVGNMLHDRVGRNPVKLSGGFTLIIQEEDCIEDLIAL